MAGILKKHQIEKALAEEKNDISSGLLKEDNPLDSSVGFKALCSAARKGDLKGCQEQISNGTNINARDEYDYTPLILASLCGHYEVVEMLLEQGALCERDTFQGERCLYNALNDKIRNLLLSYDYSKSTDPLQPLAAHVISLLSNQTIKTTDITVISDGERFELHKFILAARSPYFAKKLKSNPDIESWKLSQSVPSESFKACIRYLYLGDVGADLGDGERERAILHGIDKMSRQLEISQLFDNILLSSDRRLARQRRTEELERARDQIAVWFSTNVLGNKLETLSDKVNDVKWDKQNGIFADILLCAADEEEDFDDVGFPKNADNEIRPALSSIPIGAFGDQQPASRRMEELSSTRAVIYPCHRAMLCRSELFATMLSSPFREGQSTEYLQVVPVDCSPEVLEVILKFLYTEQAEFTLDIALEVLQAADMLFIEKLKQRAALLISTLGNGAASIVDDDQKASSEAEDVINIYDVIRAGWTTRVSRLEQFGARYIAWRLERYIVEPEFKIIVRESAGRIKERQETDTVELIDDIRYYLDDRFRMRFEDLGFEEMVDDAVADHGDTKDKVTDDEGYGGSPRGDTQSVSDTRTALHKNDIPDDHTTDEFARDAKQWRALHQRIDALMEDLGIDG